MGNKAVYSLTTIQRIALSKKKCLSTKRVLAWLENHGYELGTLQDIVLTLKESDFYKSDELLMIPGKMADVYLAMYEGEKWYVKFFVDDGPQGSCVRILSCCLDEYMH